MYREISKFILYRDSLNGTILSELGKVFEDFDRQSATFDNLRTRIYAQVRRLLELATKYGFDNNLWHNYLTFLMITDENPFSLTYEKAGVHFAACARLSRTFCGTSRSTSPSVSDISEVTRIEYLSNLAIGGFSSI